MNSSIEPQLTQDAIKLDRLNREVVKAVFEWNPDNIGKSLKKYIDTKVKIKTALIYFPVAKIHDHLAKNVLNKIGQGESFQADNIIKILESQSEEKVSLEALDDSEIEQLGSDLFYFWYSHYEYIEALYDIGSLIVSITVPEALKTYVSEARSCFAFQQYNAVYGLCRIILESAIRHTSEKELSSALMSLVPDTLPASVPVVPSETPFGSPAPFRGRIPGVPPSEAAPSETSSPRLSDCVSGRVPASKGRFPSVRVSSEGKFSPPNSSEGLPEVVEDVPLCVPVLPVCPPCIDDMSPVSLVLPAVSEDPAPSSPSNCPLFPLVSTLLGWA